MIPATESQFSDWFGLAAEVVQVCTDASSPVDSLLDQEPPSPEVDDRWSDAVMAAGQAIEICEFVLDDFTPLPSYADLAATWSEGTRKLDEWLVSMGAVNRAAVVVAAGNTDSRALVTGLVVAEITCDAIADELNHLVATQAEALGLAVGDGLGLYEWDPPLE